MHILVTLGDPGTNLTKYEKLFRQAGRGHGSGSRSLLLLLLLLLRLRLRFGRGSGYIAVGRLCGH